MQLSHPNIPPFDVVHFPLKATHSFPHMYQYPCWSRSSRPTPHIICHHRPPCAGVNSQKSCRLSTIVSPGTDRLAGFLLCIVFL